MTKKKLVCPKCHTWFIPEVLGWFITESKTKGVYCPNCGFRETEKEAEHSFTTSE